MQEYIQKRVISETKIEYMIKLLSDLNERNNTRK